MRFNCFQDLVLELWRHLEERKSLGGVAFNQLIFDFCCPFWCVYAPIPIPLPTHPPLVLPVCTWPFCLSTLILLISCEISAFCRLLLPHPKEDQRLPETIKSGPRAAAAKTRLSWGELRDQLATERSYAPLWVCSYSSSELMPNISSSGFTIFLL